MTPFLKHMKQLKLSYLFFFICLSGCMESNKCKSISDERFLEIINNALISTKKSSKNGMILNKYTKKDLIKYHIDREIEAYDDISGLIIFLDIQDKPIFKARLFNDCNIQWLP